MTQEHERQRAEIARKTAEFLSNGGKVKEIDHAATGDKALIAWMTGQKRGPVGITYAKKKDD